MSYLQFYIKFLICFGFVLTTDYFVLHFFYPKELHNFVLDLPIVYLKLIVLSFIICTILKYFYHKDFDVVGYVYLVLTIIKMGIVFYIATPILAAINFLTVEKVNFFILFLIFLGLETGLTILLLNNKPKK